MHTLWKGSISFGLVNVPIKMHAATEAKEVHFNYLHSECHNRIRYIKRCPHCDVEVSGENIIKGYEYEKDHYIVMSEEDLASIEAPMSRSIDILDFIDLSEIDPIYYQKSYYLSPEETAQKAYKLLCLAMSDTGKVAIAKLTIRSKQHLACLRVIDQNIMVLETMYYPAEIRHLESSWDNVSPTETELAMARQLIDNLATAFEPVKYRDELGEQVKELIEMKVTGETFKATSAPEPGKVIDLMEALRVSIAITDQKKEDINDGWAGEARKKSSSKKKLEEVPSAGEGAQEDKPKKKRVSKTQEDKISEQMEVIAGTEDKETKKKSTLTRRGKRKSKGA